MKRIHFIAIGGAIMHQLALALHRQGHTVTGSDDEINEPARANLQQAGILPQVEGWHPEKITKYLDVIVLGMHAKGNNPELLRAKELGIEIYSFPQYMYEVCKDKQRVVIAGSHGKTTITSMVMHILRKTGKDFDYMVGAKVEGFDTSVKLSDAPIVVLEGDEYPASAEERKPKIFFYHPHISVLSGIAWDHINVFPTYENYFGQFQQYLDGMDKGATLIYNDEDEEVQKLVSGHAGHLNAMPYHIPVYEYEDGKAVVKTENGDIEMSVFGRHNLLNMQAAILVCEKLGVPKEDAYNAIADFGGAAKRLEKISEQEGLVIYRDFAHAPSKLKATLKAVREAYPEHNLIACFELHTYSSLNEAFMNEYASSMASADLPVVYYSSHVLEIKGLPPLDENMVQKGFADDNVLVISNKEQLQKTIKEAVNQSSQAVCLLLMSSGTFDGIDWNDVSSHR